MTHAAWVLEPWLGRVKDDERVDTQTHGRKAGVRGARCYCSYQDLQVWVMRSTGQGSSRFRRFLQVSIQVVNILEEKEAEDPHSVLGTHMVIHNLPGESNMLSWPLLVKHTGDGHTCMQANGHTCKVNVNKCLKIYSFILLGLTTPLF